MAGQGRLGDKAQVSSDAHGCPSCPHTAVEPTASGSPDVNVNGRPTLRIDDYGFQAACCGPGMWTAQKGAPHVFVNGKPAFRMNDAARHCGGSGKLIEGSPNVIVGDGGGGGAGGGGTASGGGGTASGGGGTASGATGTASGRSGSTSGGGGTATSRVGSAGSAGSTATQGNVAGSRAPIQVTVELRDSGGRPVEGQRFTVRSGAGSGGGSITGEGRGSTQVAAGDGLFEVTFPGLVRSPAAALEAEAPRPRPSARHLLRRRQGEQRFSVAGEGPHSFQLVRGSARVIELEHFLDGSAVFLPGLDPQKPRVGSSTTTGIAALAACLRHAESSRDERILITGHGASRALSRLRAENVRALLAGRQKEWAQAAARAGVAELQSILRWIDVTFDWGCDPGLTDGKCGPLTRGAYDRFAVRSGTSGKLDGNGRAPQETWEAFFDLYQHALGAAVGDRAALQRDFAARLHGGTAPPGKDGRPGGYAYIRIHKDNQTSPHQISQHAGFPAAAYLRDLDPINPHLCKNGSWKAWIVPGDEINIPDSYVRPLRAWTRQRYEVQDDRVASEGGIVACREHHLENPLPHEPRRRGRQRRAEVVFFFPEDAPLGICTSDEAECRSDNCDLYDPWEYDLDYLPVRGVPLPVPLDAVEIRLTDVEGQPIAGERFVVVGADGVPIEGELDEGGVARVAVPPGKCSVSFPKATGVKRKR